MAGAISSLPPPFEITAEMKKAIIDGLKSALKSFQGAGLIGADVAYQQVVHDPETLQGFILTYKANREVLDDIVKDAAGNAVRDDLTPLSCGVTLEQIQQLLVKTCAKFHFESHVATSTVIEEVTTKSFLFFKKTEKIERQTNDPVAERLARMIVNNVAFAWQLPLLDVYRKHLSHQQLAEIDEALVALPNEAQIVALSAYDPPLLKKAKQTAGPDFAQILAERPQALPGVAAWSREMYDFYRKLLGDKAWAFFAREKSFFNFVAALDKAKARCYGDVLCFIHNANIEEIQRLNIDKTEVLVTSLRSALGPKMLVPALSSAEFSKEFLRKLVDSLLHMKGEREQLLMATQLTCKAVAPNVAEWLKRQKVPA